MRINYQRKLFLFCSILQLIIFVKCDKSNNNDNNNIINSNSVTQEDDEDSETLRYLTWSNRYRNASFGNATQIAADTWREIIRSLQYYRSSRNIKDRSTLTAIGVGGLALAGVATVGGLSLFAPHLLPQITRNMQRNYDKHGFQGVFTNGLVGISESIMGFVEKSVDDLPSLPRLDAQECVKRVICEAHNQPKKYGIFGLFLQLFFPPYTETDEPSRIVSKYQLAARYGRQENANCAAQYDGCMVNFLDMVQGVINLIF